MRVDSGLFATEIAVTSNWSLLVALSSNVTRRSIGEVRSDHCPLPHINFVREVATRYLRDLNLCDIAAVSADESWTVAPWLGRIGVPLGTEPSLCAA